MDDAKRVVIKGRAVAVPGDDIDTDRIIPARYLRCVTFDGLGEHAFEDDRLQMKESGRAHPFDAPEFAGAEIMIVGNNFGCGSSREHAPQALRRWNKGIRAVIGESFAEIFFGNCVTLGIPCVTADEKSIAELVDANRADPGLVFELDLERLTVRFGDMAIEVSMPEGPRRQLLTGRWDPTRELLQARDQIGKTAASLPYFNGWR